MLPDRVSNPGPLTYESGALPIALRGPANYCKLPINGNTMTTETRPMEELPKYNIVKNNSFISICYERNSLFIQKCYYNYNVSFI